MLALSKVRWSRIVSIKIAVFKAFFKRKCSLTAKPFTLDPIVLYIFGKLSIWEFQNSGWKSSHEASDFLWHVRNDIFHYTETLSYMSRSSKFVRHHKAWVQIGKSFLLCWITLFDPRLSKHHFSFSCGGKLSHKSCFGSRFDIDMAHSKLNLIKAAKIWLKACFEKLAVAQGKCI